MIELFANSGDPDQTPHFAASDLGLHCLLVILLRSPDCNGLKVDPKSVVFRQKCIDYIEKYPFIYKLHNTQKRMLQYVKIDK